MPRRLLLAFLQLHGRVGFDMFRRFARFVVYMIDDGLPFLPEFLQRNVCRGARRALAQFDFHQFGLLRPMDKVDVAVVAQSHRIRTFAVQLSRFPCVNIDGTDTVTDAGHEQPVVCPAQVERQPSRDGGIHPVRPDRQLLHNIQRVRIQFDERLRRTHKQTGSVGREDDVSGEQLRIAVRRQRHGYRFFDGAGRQIHFDRFGNFIDRFVTQAAENVRVDIQRSVLIGDTADGLIGDRVKSFRFRRFLVNPDRSAVQPVIRHGSPYDMVAGIDDVEGAALLDAAAHGGQEGGTCRQLCRIREVVFEQRRGTVSACIVLLIEMSERLELFARHGQFYLFRCRIVDDEIGAHVAAQSQLVAGPRSQCADARALCRQDVFDIRRLLGLQVDKPDAFRIRSEDDCFARIANLIAQLDDFRIDDIVRHDNAGVGNRFVRHVVGVQVARIRLASAMEVDDPVVELCRMKPVRRFIDHVDPLLLVHIEYGEGAVFLRTGRCRDSGERVMVRQRHGVVVSNLLRRELARQSRLEQ
ncbi:MAG: hypothetical protein K0Q73_3783 [Paenibacillus sp.]|nr:hypothetical protein [Paenibacillus sp.]